MLGLVARAFHVLDGGHGAGIEVRGRRDRPSRHPRGGESRTCSEGQHGECATMSLLSVTSFLLGDLFTGTERREGGQRTTPDSVKVRPEAVKIGLGRSRVSRPRRRPGPSRARVVVPEPLFEEPEPELSSLPVLVPPLSSPGSIAPP